jgi:RNA polymerase sigma-70 factor (ECF subfamily)
MEPSDAELLKKCRGQDMEAFACLVERHKNLLVNYMTRLTGCHDRAEDLAQETFVRFYQTLDRYREEGVLSAYLLRIGTNLVVSEERRRKRWRGLMPVFKASSNGHQPEVSPHIQALAREEQRQVNSALSSLDVLYRAPLVLREIEGLSYQEIASALECQEGTGKSRLHRGRQLLKEKLAPYWNGGHP